MTKEPDDELMHAVQIDDIPAVEVGPGVVRRPLAVTGFARGWAIDFAPGSQWPAVDHHETEERYFVHSGEMIEDEHRYGAGSYVVFRAGSKHQPRSEVGARIIGINQVG